MRILNTGFGFIACAGLALAAGCAEGENADDPGLSSGVDTGVVDAGAGDAGMVDAFAGDVGASDGGMTDSGFEDAGGTDAGAEDGGRTDAGSEDSGWTDAGSEDGGWTDAGIEDGGIEDGGIEDGGTTDAGTEDGGRADTGSELPLGLHVTAFAEEVELEDGQGTSSSIITVEGTIGEDLAGAGVLYSWNDSRFRSIEVVENTFEFELTLVTGENELIVRAEPRRAGSIEVRRIYFGAIGSRAGTHDRQCQGPGTAGRCEELCEELGGEYDGSWGHIGGCRNMPHSAPGDELDFTDPDAPPLVSRATTHDQQCLGSTSDDNRTACEELCEDYGGTYDPDWGNIGGCRDMPGSGLSDLDFTDGTLYPEAPARDATRDQQCLGATSAANIARCEELCEEYGGTHDPDWGNIGGCRDMPSSAGGLDFTHGTIRPDDGRDS